MLNCFWIFVNSSVVEQLQFVVMTIKLMLGEKVCPLKTFGQKLFTKIIIINGSKIFVFYIFTTIVVCYHCNHQNENQHPHPDAEYPHGDNEKPKKPVWGSLVSLEDVGHSMYSSCVRVVLNKYISQFEEMYLSKIKIRHSCRTLHAQ